MKNAGKACNNRLYRHIRTFEKIVKNYFVIWEKYTKITETVKSPPKKTAEIFLERRAKNVLERRSKNFEGNA